MSLTLISEHRCFQGVQRFYSHASRECATEMRFAVYTPPQALTRPVPVLYYLAGLTCSEETFMIKAGAQRIAAQVGLMLVTPDTSPRKSRMPGDDASWDFGLGAGFYLDAVAAPWSGHYRMYSYVTRELPELIAKLEGADVQRSGIFGHSMGGHGALVAALRNPEKYRSVSAFAPICAPTQCAWGQKAFNGYLGNDARLWSHYDATALVAVRRHPHPILIDQGTADKFLAEQLKPELFVAACQKSETLVQLRRQEGYDHGYYFIATFIEDHLRHHAQQLCW